MKKENESVIQEKFKTLIGGQALIEGIMMQGPDKRSIVVRGPEGIVTKVEPLKKRTGIAKWPLIRGVVNFASSMVSGVKALMYSAEFFPEEEDAKPSKFDAWQRKDGEGGDLVLRRARCAVFRRPVLPAADADQRPV